MTSAYVVDAKKNVQLKSVPEELVLPKTKESVIFDLFNEENDFEGLYQIFENIIDEGQTYPQETTDRESFRAYFLSHHCFVFRLKDTKQVIAGIYIKPNFPGRASHIANGGLIVKKDQRGKGLGDL